jgi:hypothetical protein
VDGEAPTIGDADPWGWQPAATEEAPGQNTPPRAAQGTQGPLQGEVRGFRERRESEGDISPIVWAFRLERYRDGARLPPIPVEMRGAAFAGFINEGDTVVLYDRWRTGTTARVTRVYNLTGGAEVRALDRSAVFIESLKALLTTRSLFGAVFSGMLLLIILITLTACVIVLIAVLRFPALSP